MRACRVLSASSRRVSAAAAAAVSRSRPRRVSRQRRAPSSRPRCSRSRPTCALLTLPEGSLSPQPCHQPTPAAFADQDRDRRDAPAHRPRLVQGGGGGHRRLAAKDQRRLQQSRAAAAAQQAVADQEVARADERAAAALQCSLPRPANPSPPSLLPPSLTSHRQLPPLPPPPLPDFAPLERRPTPTFLVVAVLPGITYLCSEVAKRQMTHADTGGGEFPRSPSPTFGSMTSLGEEGDDDSLEEGEVSEGGTPADKVIVHAMPLPQQQTTHTPSLQPSLQHPHAHAGGGGGAAAAHQEGGGVRQDSPRQRGLRGAAGVRRTLQCRGRQDRRARGQWVPCLPHSHPPHRYARVLKLAPRSHPQQPPAAPRALPHAHTTSLQVAAVQPLQGQGPGGEDVGHELGV